MKTIELYAGDQPTITKSELKKTIQTSLESYPNANRVLLLPPDATRSHSEAGILTNLYYEQLSPSCQVDIMPALGTHMAMTPEEIHMMYGDKIPLERYLVHNWKEDVVKLGEVPEAFVEEVSEGLFHGSIDVEVNKRIVDGSYDLIISIGQVVPHAVVGLANYSKNIFVGCGGKSMIDKTHMLAAIYGMERIMGLDQTPVRRIFDYAQDKYLKDIPLIYVLTVTTQQGNDNSLAGVFFGSERDVFEKAVSLSQKKNITMLKEPAEKIVAYMEGHDFKSTWLSNKAIYRSRMAIKDGGELVIIAPGVKQFGEDDGNDALIRQFGYMGSQEVVEAMAQYPELRENQSAAAHLIHGASEGRFKITYVVKELSEEAINSVGYDYMSLEEGLKQYDIDSFTDGWNTMADGEKIYYISNPALGLWSRTL